MPVDKDKTLTISTNFTVKLNKIDPQCENVFQPNPVRGNDNVPAISNYTGLHFDICCFLHGSYASSGTNSFENCYYHSNSHHYNHINFPSHINTYFHNHAYAYREANANPNRNHHRQPNG